MSPTFFVHLSGGYSQQIECASSIHLMRTSIMGLDDHVQRGGQPILARRLGSKTMPVLWLLTR